MNFIKKFAVTAALLMLIALPAHAETAETYSDDFNQHTEEKTKFNYYPTDTGKTSDLFTDLGRWCSAFSLVKHEDCYGKESMMLKIAAADSDDAVLPVRTMTYKPGQVVQFSYDIYFDELPKDGKNYTNIGSANSNYNLKIGAGDSSILGTGWDGRTYTLSEDTWYKILLVVDAHGTQKIHLMNSAGNEILFTSDSTTYSDGAALDLYAVWLSWAAPSATILIDNAAVTVYNPAENAPSVVKSSVEAGEDNVQRNKTLTFVFDQELSDESVVKFTEKDGKEIPGVKTEKLSYNTLSVTYDGLLKRDTDYKLSFEAVSNGALTCSDDITFTTEDLHIWNDVEVSSATANEDDAKLTDITFTIGDDYGYPTFTGSVMAAVYQAGKMLDVDMQSLTDAKTGELTVSFDLGIVPEDAEINLILLDVEKGPVPLAGGRLEN
ncbi:MAG: Ig-like domain-containing protein [Clostridia bacterium]|nr:Ig-like domain-containing protein [Clostridia bacterium]